MSTLLLSVPCEVVPVRVRTGFGEHVSPFEHALLEAVAGVAPDDRGGDDAPRWQSIDDLIELGAGAAIAFEVRPLGGGRRDLYLAEPPWDGRRLLVRDVARVIFGAGRALALVRKIGGRGERGAGAGDMVLVDLASGAETLLARNVVDMALPRPCAGCDPLAAGAPVLYSVQARVPYRFDGLWLGTLP